MPQFEMMEARPGLRIAFDLREAPRGDEKRPGFLWLGGFKSDMIGSKAERLRELSGRDDRLFIRFDYSGHGASEGRFEDGTLSLWLAEARHVLRLAGGRPMILIGSSMGGFLALLLAREGSGNIAGLVLVAPAADMTFNMEAEIAKRPDAQEALARDGVWRRPSRYGDPYPITAKLLEDGRHHRLLERGLDLVCPLRILHGDQDPDVPWQHGLKTFQAIRAADAHFTLIKDGDHRLSREQDIITIHRAAEELALLHEGKVESSAASPSR
ncbi:alpha/beta hydrolase [Aestuariivirga sp. YIM B02566]|nr:alpha/beta fold hydrolase [Aestuariivirga sp. YIM B02566]